MAQKLETKTDRVSGVLKTLKNLVLLDHVSPGGPIGFLKKMSSNLMYVYI